jgi:hypothetical protein
MYRSALDADSGDSVTSYTVIHLRVVLTGTLQEAIE